MEGCSAPFVRYGWGAVAENLRGQPANEYFRSFTLVLSADSRPIGGGCARTRTPELRVPRRAYAVASYLCMHVYDNRRVVVLRRYKKAAMIRRGGTHMLRTAASASAALRASVRFCKTSTSSPCRHDSASLIFLLNVSAAAAAMLAPNPIFHPLALNGSQACGMSGVWNEA